MWYLTPALFFFPPRRCSVEAFAVAPHGRRSSGGHGHINGCVYVLLREGREGKEHADVFGKSNLPSDLISFGTRVVNNEEMLPHQKIEHSCERVSVCQSGCCLGEVIHSFPVTHAQLGWFSILAVKYHSAASFPSLSCFTPRIEMESLNPHTCYIYNIKSSMSRISLWHYLPLYLLYL